MKTFTAHMPPASGNKQRDALQTVFVKDGFSIWAFLFPHLWLLVHRMWLVLVALRRM